MKDKLKILYTRKLKAARSSENRNLTELKLNSIVLIFNFLCEQ